MNETKRRSWTDEEKRSIIKEAEASGQPIKTFCKEKGITSGLFYRWRLGASGKLSTRRSDDERREERSQAERAKDGGTRYTDEQVADIVRRWEESDLSGPEFSKQCGISQSSLYQLRARYRKDSSPRAIQRRAQTREAAPTSRASGDVLHAFALPQLRLRCRRGIDDADDETQGAPAAMKKAKRKRIDVFFSSPKEKAQAKAKAKAQGLSFSDYCMKLMKADLEKERRSR